MSKLFLVLRILLGLAFAAAAAAKIAGAPMMVAEFGKIGFGQGFRYVTAATELIAVALLGSPRTATIGAGLLVCVCIGALIAQATVLHGDIIHCIVLGGIAGCVGWYYRGALTRLRTN